MGIARDSERTSLIGLVGTPDKDLRDFTQVDLSPLEAQVLSFLLNSPDNLKYMSDCIDEDLTVADVQVFEPKQNARGAGVYISFTDSKGRPAEFGWRIGKAQIGSGVKFNGKTSFPEGTTMTVSRKTTFKVGVDADLGESQTNLRTIIGGFLERGSSKKLEKVYSFLKASANIDQRSTKGTTVLAAKVLDLRSDIIPIRIETNDSANVVTSIKVVDAEEANGRVSFGVQGKSLINVQDLEILSAKGHLLGLQDSPKPDTTMNNRVVLIKVTGGVLQTKAVEEIPARTIPWPLTLEFTERTDVSTGERYHEFSITPAVPSTR